MGASGERRASRSVSLAELKAAAAAAEAAGGLPPTPVTVWHLVGAAVAVLAAAVLLWIAVPPAVEGVDALRWDRVPGDLLEAGLGTDVVRPPRGEAREVAWVSLRYTYSVRGADGATTHHQGSRFDAATWNVGRRTFSPTPAKAAMVREASADAPSVEVRVNPRDPARSLLRPGVPFDAALLLLGAMALLGGAQAVVRDWAAGGFRPRAGSAPGWLVGFPLGGLALAGSLAILLNRHGSSAPPSWPLLAYAVLFGGPMLVPAVKALRPVGYALLPAAGVIALLMAAAAAEWLRVDVDEWWWKPDDAVVVARLDSANPNSREDAAWRVFRAEGPREAVPGLGRCLDDADADIRRAALAALLTMPPLSPPLLERLERMAAEDPDDRCRERAAIFLRKQRAGR